jgi:hypothetical protein
MILQEFAFPPRAKNTLESRSGKGECGLFESLAPGGAFILVEKILGATAKLDEAFVNLFLNIKREWILREPDRPQATIARRRAGSGHRPLE